MDSLLSMSPFKCLKSILFICFCVYMPRLSSLPEDRHFVSIHASLTVVLKSFYWEVRKKSSRFCSPEKGGGAGEVPHCMWCHTIQISSAVSGEKQMSVKPTIHSSNKYSFIQRLISARCYTRHSVKEKGHASATTKLTV